MQRDSPTRLSQFQAPQVDPTRIRTVTPSRPGAEVYDVRTKLGGLQALGSSLSNFFGTTSKVVEKKAEQEHEAFQLEEKRKALNAADAAYEDFTRAKRTWDPDQEDLSDFSKRFFEQRFGSELNSESAYDQTLYWTFRDRVRSDEFAAADLQANRRVAKTFSDIVTNIENEARTGDTRAGIDSERLVDWVTQLRETDPQLTEGESYAHVLKSLKVGVDGQGMMGAAWFEKFASSVAIDAEGRTFEEKFPDAYVKLTRELTQSAYGAVTASVLQQVESLTSQAKLAFAEGNLEKLIDIAQKRTETVSQYGGAAYFQGLDAFVESSVKEISAQRAFQQALIAQRQNPLAYVPIDEDRYRKGGLVGTLKAGGLMDVGTLRDDQIIVHADTINSMATRMGYLPDDYANFLGMALSDKNNPSRMQQSLQILQGMLPENRQKFFAVNSQAEAIWSAFQHASKGGMGSDTFVTSVLTNEDYLDQLKNFKWEEHLQGRNAKDFLLGAKNTSSFLSLFESREEAPELLKAFEDNAGESFGFLDNFQLTDRASERVMTEIKYRLAFEHMQNGAVSESRVKEIRDSVLRDMVTEGRVRVTRKDDGWFQDSWTVDTSSRAVKQWGGPHGTYADITDEFGRQEIRALPGESIPSPNGGRENTLLNQRTAIEEITEKFALPGDQRIVPVEEPNTVDGSRALYIKFDSGRASMPLVLAPGQTVTFGDSKLTIPSSFTKEALSEWVKSAGLPKGVYPVVRQSFTGKPVIYLKAYPHFRNFESLEERKQRQIDELKATDEFIKQRDALAPW